MSALITIAAVAATIAVPALLLAVTGGPDLLYTHHTLPRPRHTTRRATKEGRR